MNNFPKGNDLIVKWAIKYSDGSAFPLANYAWELCYSAGRGINVVQDTAVISVEDNVLTWRFAGKEQAFKGSYNLTLRLYQNGKVVATVSKNNAFTLDDTKYDGPCDIDLVSYCDNISLQDALLRGNKAMEVARQADGRSVEALDKANTAIAKVEGIEEATEAAVAAASSANSAATNASEQAAIAQQNNATFAENEAQRVSTFQTNEASRIETFASKEAERDAANEAALNAASKLSELARKTDLLSYEVEGFDGNKMADLSNVVTSGYIDSSGKPQANASWVRGTIPVVTDASAIVFKNVPTIQYYASAYNYWVNALGERVGALINCNKTMGLPNAEIAIPNGAVSMMVSLPSSVSLASLDISFKVKKDGILTRLEDAETAIGNQSAETNRLREELVSTELSGVVTSSYDWVADVVFPSGITIKNEGSVDLNLYKVKSFSSSDYVTIRVGEKVVLPYEIVAVRSKSQKGDYKLIRYGEINILDDKIADANAKIDSLASVTALKASVSALANGETLSIANAPQCIKIGDCISFYAKISSFGDGFTIGKASGYYASGYIDITPTSCIFKEYSTSESVKATINHGLVFEEFVKVVIKMDGTKWDLVLQTLKGTFVHSFDSSNTRSVTRVTSNGASLTDLELKYTNETINKSIWAFGDSYFSINSTSRQFYYLKEWGFLNFMVNGFPGASSGQMSAEIDRCLAIAKPKYIIWCLGMNDNGAITQDWQPTLNKVKSLCTRYNITLIMCTIPIAKNTTYKHKDEMNAVVVNSGYRFVDVAKAVGSNASGEWFGYGTANDYCSSDGVHPSTIGAKAIATQFLVDVPELMA